MTAREADRADARAWSLRMEGYGGPAQPSPTIGQASTAAWAGWRSNAIAVRHQQACRSMPSVEPVHPGGLFLIEDLVACVCEHWNIIPHLHQTQIDQLPQMIWIDRKQCPLGFDVSKRPDEVDGPKGVDP
jgi:hypothetical protein